MMSQDLSKIEEKIIESTAWEKTKEFLGWHLDVSKDISISIFDLIVIITAIFITTLILRLVLRLITREFTSTEIGAELYISLGTVETHRRNLIGKLNVKNTAGLVRKAIEYKLV